jgi:hypothetical protein
MAANEQVQYSASQVECAIRDGMNEATSTTPPCINIKYPHVERPLSGQSWNDESVKLTIGELLWMPFCVVVR